ncbi:unnamed protein product [Protopolystoma xenopodis]|uniref:Uncharacterized protein n=1 Tax=Protopolystoma xenopodis TaxID=117903 RepID=A0A3S5CLR9_9PLAT|nr:unnamed protein product [Protopolystoma xenopodis]
MDQMVILVIRALMDQMVRKVLKGHLVRLGARVIVGLMGQSE